MRGACVHASLAMKNGQKVAGVAFYDFGRVGDLRSFKAAYRARLDGLGEGLGLHAGLSQADADCMVSSDAPLQPTFTIVHNRFCAVACLCPCEAAARTLPNRCHRALLTAVSRPRARSTPLSVASQVAEANFAFELNTALFHELDRLGGFGGGGGDGGQEVEVPAPPDFSALTAASVPSPEAVTSPSAADGGGCPFAALAKAGMPLPVHHPPSGSGAAPRATSAVAVEVAGAHDAPVAKSKCPFAVGFSLVDLAVVLVLVALMLMVMPGKDTASSRPAGM